MNIPESIPHWASLPDGTVVDISTKEGANAFLNGVSSFNYFSSNLKEIRKLRKKKRLNASDEMKLEKLFRFVSLISRHADQETFRAKIPQSEVEHWLNYTIEAIKGFTKQKRWLDYGLLEVGDYLVLHSCAMMFTGFHALPVRLAFESELFQVLANSVKARKGNGRALPHAVICHLIGQIACAASHSASRNFDKPWWAETVCKKFEASGMLEQILRCSTVCEGEAAGARSCWDTLLSNLDFCVGYMTSKFKPGTPCGDTLKAILDGRDGNGNIRPGILNRLQGIARLVEAMDTTQLKERYKRLISMECKFCGKSDSPLSSCSECHSAYYCSKECQRAGWKEHKPYCLISRTPFERNRQMVLLNATCAFMNQNALTVFAEIGKKCGSTGSNEGDVVVEVDFMTTADGVIPALQDPPTFRVVLIQDYKSGKEIPVWLNAPKYSDEERFSKLNDIVQAMEKNRTPNSPILFLHYGGSAKADHRMILRYREAVHRLAMEQNIEA